MEFMELPPRKKRRPLVVHFLILFFATATLGAFGLADDEVTGRAKVSDACGFTLIFLVAAYFVAWLPAIWEKSDGTMLEPLVMPVFIALVVAYLYFSYRSYFIQPAATGATVFSHFFVLIYLSCRIE